MNYYYWIHLYDDNKQLMTEFRIKCVNMFFNNYLLLLFKFEKFCFVIIKIKLLDYCTIWQEKWWNCGNNLVREEREMRSY